MPYSYLTDVDAAVTPAEYECDLMVLTLLSLDRNFLNRKINEKSFLVGQDLRVAWHNAPQYIIYQNESTFRQRKNDFWHFVPLHTYEQTRMIKYHTSD